MGMGNQNQNQEQQKKFKLKWWHIALPALGIVALIVWLSIAGASIKAKIQKMREQKAAKKDSQNSTGGKSGLFSGLFRKKNNTAPATTQTTPTPTTTEPIPTTTTTTTVTQQSTGVTVPVTTTQGAPVNQAPAITPTGKQIAPNVYVDKTKQIIYLKDGYKPDFMTSFKLSTFKGFTKVTY
jgi:cytoskeletal protein RodZ